MRLFIAIELSECLRRSLRGVINGLRADGVKGNYTRSENLHLTLAFIGESDDTAPIRQVIDGVRVRPFDMVCEGAGHFGDLLWAGIRPCKPLDQLAEQLCEGLMNAGFNIEKRSFRPHITLVRKASRVASPAVPAVSMRVERITLMRSEHIDGRLTYTPVYSRRL